MNAQDCPANSSPWWNIFDASSYVTRDNCGVWPQWQIVSAVIPSVSLFILYLFVGVSLMAVWRMSSRDEHRHTKGLVSVALFFVGCAGGHLHTALAFHWPAYRFFIVWDWGTLIVSAFGVWGLALTFQRLMKENRRLIEENKRLAILVEQLRPMS